MCILRQMFCGRLRLVYVPRNTNCLSLADCIGEAREFGFGQKPLAALFFEPLYSPARVLLIWSIATADAPTHHLRQYCQAAVGLIGRRFHTVMELLNLGEGQVL